MWCKPGWSASSLDAATLGSLSRTSGGASNRVVWSPSETGENGEHGKPWAPMAQRCGNGGGQEEGNPRGSQWNGNEAQAVARGGGERGKPHLPAPFNNLTSLFILTSRIEHVAAVARTKHARQNVH